MACEKSLKRWLRRDEDHYGKSSAPVESFETWLLRSKKLTEDTPSSTISTKAHESYKGACTRASRIEELLHSALIRMLRDVYSDVPESGVKVVGSVDTIGGYGVESKPVVNGMAVTDTFVGCSEVCTLTEKYTVEPCVRGAHITVRSIVSKIYADNFTELSDEVRAICYCVHTEPDTSKTCISWGVLK